MCELLFYRCDFVYLLDLSLLAYLGEIKVSVKHFEA